MNEKLTRLEIIYLMVWTVMGTGILAIPYAIGQFTVRDGWLSIVLISATGWSLVVVSFFHRRVFQTTSLTQSFNLAFGRWVGGAIGLWYLLCLYLVVATVWRELALFLASTSYPETSFYYLGAVFIFPVALGVYKGIKSIALFSDFLAPLAIVVTFLFVILSTGSIQFSSLKPVLADGWTPILRGGIVPSVTYTLEPLVVLQFIGDLKNSKSIPWDLAIALVVIFVFLTVIEVVSIGVLSGATSSFQYPVLDVIQIISVGKFLERLDTLYVMGVLSTVYVKLSVFQYAFCKGIAELFHLSDYKFVAWTASLAAWAGSVFLFADSHAVGDFIIYSAPAYFIATFVVLPLLTAWLYQAISKRNAAKSGTTAS